jgi:hypothetical protein
MSYIRWAKSILTKGLIPQAIKISVEAKMKIRYSTFQERFHICNYRSDTAMKVGGRQ